MEKGFIDFFIKHKLDNALISEGVTNFQRSLCRSVRNAGIL